MGSPERKLFLESMVGYLLDTRSTEALKFLLTEEEAWKQLVEETGLSREEEITLHETLREITADPDVEDEDELQNDLQEKTERDEEEALSEALGDTIVDSDIDDEYHLQRELEAQKRFLDVYPQVKLELEQHIRKLHDLADKVDKVHRGCTITQVVASSTSAVSGILTILGIALAPVTAGVSLGLSATGLGLGAAAAVTSVSTSIVEKVSTVSVEAEASQLVPTNKDTANAIKEILEKNTPRLVSVSKNSFQNLEVIKKNIDAIKLAKANPRLANNAKRLMTTGTVSARKTRQVQKAFGGTALAMTKGARIMGAATAGIFLVMDVVSLVEDSKHLHEGAKADYAAELRKQAQDLELKLQELIQIHDSLTQ
ncbi:apolipoprotein L3 isoform X2 [Cricetulus griseus]|uniref:Apolipoprotein L3 isoform X2 n=1 Tax=Cricetulus griseus TaxID=10029 RepID=A0A9J7FKB6_CRIGR|nr:apolipoprotein L3 isoform X2 [Cricetulus griseus]XP_027259709.1 apolipoprotein L3 isoform X2 [Cricetulus griseus]XP_027259710.1 apolipoprotein L3 isoform X2 [Cricetulus griseus]XP_027259711.1 apolipoprotein L3 isoform X2 [Cricetulus griseus]